MRVFAAAALLAALPAYAQMYKCVDERGVTHYSDKPRQDCKGGAVDIRGQPPISGALQAPKGDMTGQDADFKRRQIERERAQTEQNAARDERCAAIKREYDFYSRGGRLARLESGRKVYVDDATRDARLAALKEQMRACP